MLAARAIPGGPGPIRCTGSRPPTPAARPTSEAEKQTKYRQNPGPEMVELRALGDPVVRIRYGDSAESGESATHVGRSSPSSPEPNSERRRPNIHPELDQLRAISGHRALYYKQGPREREVINAVYGLGTLSGLEPR